MTKGCMAGYYRFRRAGSRCSKQSVDHMRARRMRAFVMSRRFGRVCPNIREQLRMHITV